MSTRGRGESSNTNTGTTTPNANANDGRRPSSGSIEDYQQWYDKVWQGFDSTGLPPANPSPDTELDDILNGYVDDGRGDGEDYSYNGQATTSRPSPAPSHSNTNNLRPSQQYGGGGSARSSSASGSSSPFRPLPLPPGLMQRSSPTPTSSTSSSSMMPTPVPYDHSQGGRAGGLSPRPSYVSSQSTSSTLSTSTMMTDNSSLLAVEPKKTTLESVLGVSPSPSVSPDIGRGYELGHGYGGRKGLPGNPRPPGQRSPKHSPAQSYSAHSHSTHSPAQSYSSHSPSYTSSQSQSYSSHSNSYSQSPPQGQSSPGEEWAPNGAQAILNGRAPIARNTSVRPPGALAPATPGHAGGGGGGSLERGDSANSSGMGGSGYPGGSGQTNGYASGSGNVHARNVSEHTIGPGLGLGFGGERDRSKSRERGRDVAGYPEPEALTPTHASSHLERSSSVTSSTVSSAVSQGSTFSQASSTISQNPLLSRAPSTTHPSAMSLSSRGLDPFLHASETGRGSPAVREAQGSSSSSAPGYTPLGYTPSSGLTAQGYPNEKASYVPSPVPGPPPPLPSIPSEQQSLSSPVQPLTSPVQGKSPGIPNKRSGSADMLNDIASAWGRKPETLLQSSDSFGGGGNAVATGSGGGGMGLGHGGALGLHHEEEVDEFWDDDDELDEAAFINFALLSHIAVQLKDRVPRGSHMKGGVSHERAFTGRDVVSTIQSIIQRELSINHNIPTSDRRPALQIARSLQSQLFFAEIEWNAMRLSDGVEHVYTFSDEAGAPGLDRGDSFSSTGAGSVGYERETRDREGERERMLLFGERAELPTGVVTIMTGCYSPSCSAEDWEGCYAHGCPRKGNYVKHILVDEGDEGPRTKEEEDWKSGMSAKELSTLSESEINRQTIIHRAIKREAQYLKELSTIETYFIQPLRRATPPIIDPYRIDDFIDEIFGNILDLRECNRRLLEVLLVRQREAGHVIDRIGDVFLGAASDFRLAYPTYLGNLPLGEQKLKEEMEGNAKFRLFLEQCSREIPEYQHETVKPPLKQLLQRPLEHMQKYPQILRAIHNDTAAENPDAEFLKEAMKAISNLHSVGQLRTFQSSMGKGVASKWEWNDLVSNDVRKKLSKDVIKRQSVIFELIKGEMAYVKDLENIEIMYVRPLRAAEPPIIPRERLNQFINDVFHNFHELHVHHKRMVDQFHEIQREEHPTIRSISAPVFDAALNFREAYMEYVPNYPIAAYRIDDEMATNPAFKKFVEDQVRHPDAHRLDMKNFINRPIPRLLRYELLLKSIFDETTAAHEDRQSIPEIINIIKALGKETEPGVESAKGKVELWRYNSNLTFKPGDWIDMDLLDEFRSLLHTGKLLRQPETGFEWSGWGELFVLLFDNYLVMTKVKESKDGVTKYHVNRRPIPLDLLTLVNFTDPPTQRTTGILRGLRGGERHAEGAPPLANGVTSPDSAVDSRVVYPCTLHHNGRMGGPYILYAESAQVRAEWKQKLEEALGLRKVVQESNKVFEIETLSTDTFTIPAMVASTAPAWNENVTGKVTCSVPFTTADGRGLVAIGCAAGVWIGFRHDSRSMRQVLHLKQVTQCAMLENFGIFLVLADKQLFAYHIEALVPSSPNNAHFNQAPEKLNGTKDVHFFSVGTLHGRTLVIYMKKKGLDSVFRVLEPVGERINDRSRAPAGIGQRFGFRPARSAWFRVYRDFFLPSESFDLVFLKAQIAILCTKGFEIMDLTDFKSVTIPQRDDAKLEKLVKRCEACRPLGMFRCTDDEFLLCYDEFGLYIDKHGDPSRSLGTIEWEGRAERVALHHPYVLLFDSRFIEIRHISTGRLAQIIQGHDLRCLWDGRGLNSNASASSPGGEDGMDQEARVHAVMTPPEAVGRSGRAVPQLVFELIPTIPLYLPGSLASPSEPSYFAQSFSPPHSPTLRPQTSYRS